MSSEPPDTAQEQDPGVAERPPGRHIRGRASGNGRRSAWSSVAAVAGALAVAGGVAAFLFLSPASDRPAEQTVPARGLACPDLRQAASAYERGDRDTFERAIARAAKVAEETLEKSGQIFGEPERIALELGLQDDRPSEEIVLLLSAAQAACLKEPAQS